MELPCPLNYQDTLLTLCLVTKPGRQYDTAVICAVNCRGRLVEGFRRQCHLVLQSD